MSDDETRVRDEGVPRFADESTEKEGFDGYSCENIG